MADQPSLQQFETFLVVAQAQGITAAANKLGISKAAVSHSIRLLEESLQVPLFIRTTRKIELTDEGRLLLQQCLRLKEELDTARQLVSQFTQEPTGLLRISCNPYLAIHHLIPILQEYRNAFPKVNVEVLSEERMPNMHDEHIDIVFGVNWPAPDDVIARKIGNTRYVLCASPEYLKTKGMPKKLSDLKQHNYIPHLGRKSNQPLVHLKKESQVDVYMPIKSNNAQFMKACALNHLGIVQLHDYMVNDELASGQLIEVLTQLTTDNIPLYIYYQKHRFVQPKIRQFVNLILQKKINT